jgi:ribosomal protein S18 acetylase RimI-like enzyme
MRNRFFTANRNDLRFEWNTANVLDWTIIQRNFVSAYICAYQKNTLQELMFDVDLLKEAQELWQTTYDHACKKGIEVLINKIINPLKFYFAHENTPFQTEINELEKHFLDNSYTIGSVQEHFIKLIMLQRYFENDFINEKIKIHSTNKKIDYLIARYNDAPIAFFVTELNYKSGRVYLRWVTIEPGFHRQGLGEIIMSQIAKHYPDAIGMELYTRKANVSAQKFYKHCGFQETQNFEFGQPTFKLNGKIKLYLPEDDMTHSPNAFIAFYKRFEISCRA